MIENDFIPDLANWEFYSGQDESKNPVWSGSFAPPTIGTRIKINLNGWEGCKGTIVGYQVNESANLNFIGALVRPDVRPAWHRKEMPERDICYFVGRELELE